MKKEIAVRTEEMARYIIKTHQTLRDTAKVFGVSKSTVHYDLAFRLEKINSKLYRKIRKVLGENFSEKHIRGGLATKKKYLKN